MPDFTDYQKNAIIAYLKGPHWDASPMLLMMDYVGRVWKVEKTLFNNFVGSDGKIVETSAYKKSGRKRYFGGWDNKDSHYMWDVTRRDLNHVDGYHLELNSETPSKEANGNNYYSEDDRELFKTKSGYNKPEEKQVIYPSEIANTTSYTPNSIPGYTLISYDNTKFVTMSRGFDRYDVAFILFQQMTDKTAYANDIFQHHPNLIDRIFREKYGIPRIEACIAGEMSQSQYDWDFKSGNVMKYLNAGKCLEDANGLKSSDCNMADGPQQWTFNGGDTKKILKHTESGRCLKFYEMGKKYNNVLDSSFCTEKDVEATWKPMDKLLEYNRFPGQCLYSDGSSIDIKACDPSNKNQEWDTYSNQFRHIASNKCMIKHPSRNGPQMAACSVLDSKVWRLENHLIKNKKTGNALDANGSSVYLGTGSDANSFQQWDIKGNNIIHRKSGKCLGIDGQTPTLYNCSCDKLFDDDVDDYRMRYIDYLNNSYNQCIDNKTWAYDTTEPCDNILFNTNDLLEKKVAWCMNTPGSNCDFDFLQSEKAYLKAKQILCSTNNNIIDKKVECKLELLDDKNTSFYSWEFNLYKKVLYYDILTNWCDQGNSETKYACTNYFLKDIETDQTKLDGLNTIWKKYNCVGNIPYPIYDLLKDKPVREQDAYIMSLATSANRFARLMCYTGETLESGMKLLPNQSIYSKNRRYKLMMQTNGNLVLYKNEISIWSSGTTGNANAYFILQPDNRLIVYSSSKKLLWEWKYSPKSNSISFLVIRDDLGIVLNNQDGTVASIVTKSGFRDRLDEEMLKSPDYSYLIYMIIFIVVAYFIAYHYQKHRCKQVLLFSTKKNHES